MAELYERHARRLYSFLAYRVDDPGLAEDLLSTVFERVLTARRPFDPRRGAEVAWLFRIAVNVLNDEHRRAGREARSRTRAGHDRESDPGAAGLDLGDREELLAAVRGLSDEEREVIALRFGADLTVPEIATTLGTKVTTVDGRLYRALRKLRVELG